MLRACRELVRCRVAGKDGDFGKVSDICFNDRTWKTEFFVVSLGRGRSARSVLLPLEAIASLDIHTRTVNTSWTPAQIEDAPSAHSVLPVSRLLTPSAITPSAPHASPYLRSYLALKGCLALSGKQPRGELSDILLDDSDWSVRYIQLQFPIQKKVVHFHLHSLAVERFSGVSRKIFLKQFEPVQIEDQLIVQFPAIASSEASIA